MNRLLSILKMVLERVFAFVSLILLLPMLLCVGALIGGSAGRPVLLLDTVAMRNGKFVQRHRLRTTGSGGTVFRSIGRFMRQCQMDELPVLWDIVCGRIRWQDVIPQ